MLPPVAYVTSGADAADHGSIVAALADAGLDVQTLTWDHPADWSHFALVLSHVHDGADRPAFLRWAREVERQCGLVNSARTLARTSDRNHLRDLGRAGIGLVPTLWIEPGDDPQTAAEQLADWSDAFTIRPNLGGQVESVADPDAAAQVVHAMLAAGQTVSIQPTLDGVTSVGVIDGRPMFCEVSDTGPQGLEDSLSRFTSDVLEAGDYGESLLWARLTVVPAGDSWRLVDLNACAPGLPLGARPDAARAFGQAVRTRITE